MNERCNVVVGKIGDMDFAISGLTNVGAQLIGSDASGIKSTSAKINIPKSVEDASRNLISISNAILNSWAENWECIKDNANPPDEVSVTLSLGFEASAGIWFVSGTGNGGVEISMSWSRQGDAK